MTSTFAARAAVTAASLAAIAPMAGCTGTTPTPSTPPSQSAPEAGSGSPSAGRTGTGDYRDGTYTVRGVYGGAPSYMTITVTLAADAIRDVTVKPMPDNNDTSRGYQERFAAAVPVEVIGKSIDGLSVGKIAGASGCADGFNDALTKIRERAGTNR